MIGKPLSTGLRTLTPEEAARADLTPDVKREVRRRLDALREARARAEVASRFYVVGAAHGGSRR